MSENTPKRPAPLERLRGRERETRASSALDRRIASTPTWGGENGGYAIARNRKSPGLPSVKTPSAPSPSAPTSESPVAPVQTPQEQPTTPTPIARSLPGRSSAPSVTTPIRVNTPSITEAPRVTPSVPLPSPAPTVPSTPVARPLPTRKTAPVPSAFVQSEEWEEDTVVEREDQRRKYWSGGSGFRVTERDEQILRFLGRYRYAQTSQVARYINTSVKATQIRLSKMGKVNLVRREDITSGQAVWTPTAAGLAVADLDIRVIGEGQISLVTMAHTLGIINIGIELELGGADLLGESGWPHYNRVDELTGEALLGERVLTEREVSQGQNRWKKQKERGQLREIIEGRIQEWEEVGRQGTAPELLPGNEGMFVLYSTAKIALGGSGEHVPDMVVVRDRDDQGKPHSIAIELELQSKPLDEWKRILRSYKASDMYGKLIYFTHKPAIRNALIRLNNEEVGMSDNEFEVRKYIPAGGRQPFWG